MPRDDYPPVSPPARSLPTLHRAPAQYASARALGVRGLSHQSMKQLIADMDLLVRERVGAKQASPLPPDR